MYSALAAASLGAFIATALLLANPRRLANITFAGFTAHISIWLTIVAILFESEDRAPWLRANAIVSSFAPWTLWLVQASLATTDNSKSALLRNSLPWFLASAMLLPLCLSDSYVGIQNSRGIFVRGWAYFTHCALQVGLLAAIVLKAARDLKKRTGVQKIELQFVVFNFGLSAISCIVFLIIANAFHIFFLKIFGLIAITLGFATAGWAINHRRVFNLRQVSTAVLRKSVFMLLLGISTVSLTQILDGWVTPLTGMVLSLTTSSIFGVWLDRKLGDWFSASERMLLAEQRGVAINLSSGIVSTEVIILRFESFLRSSYEVAKAEISFSPDSNRLTDGTNPLLNYWASKHLSQKGWETPESIQRARQTEEQASLYKFMVRSDISLLVIAPRGATRPSLTIAFGSRKLDLPFTYPEIQRIQNLAELMDNILTHSRLTNQAALKARIELLAMMSRGLAHDLKNLVTPISSFLVHSELRVASGTPEREVLLLAQRSIRVFNDYVGDALFFGSAQRPNIQRVNPADLIQTVAGLAGPRAKGRRVSIAVTSAREHSLEADAVLLQRMLVNLVNNAIDASPDGSTVKLSVEDSPPDGIRFQIADQGGGIAPDLLARIFEPYFTTKQFGDDIRGFGLGLTISKKIADLHNGTITVRSELGEGSTFIVELPTIHAVAASETVPASDFEIQTAPVPVPA